MLKCSLGTLIYLKKRFIQDPVKYERQRWPEIGQENPTTGQYLF